MRNSIERWMQNGVSPSHIISIVATICRETATYTPDQEEAKQWHKAGELIDETVATLYIQTNK